MHRDWKILAGSKKTKSLKATSSLASISQFLRELLLFNSDTRTKRWLSALAHNPRESMCSENFFFSGSYCSQGRKNSEPLLGGSKWAPETSHNLSPTTSSSSLRDELSKVTLGTQTPNKIHPSQFFFPVRPWPKLRKAHPTPDSLFTLKKPLPVCFVGTPSDKETSVLHTCNFLRRMASVLAVPLCFIAFQNCFCAE